jgi:hypothetical protein
MIGAGVPPLLCAEALVADSAATAATTAVTAHAREQRIPVFALVMLM